MPPDPSNDSSQSEEEETTLFERLNRRVPSTKEIESTVAGEAGMTVQILLPSFFELYPRALEAYQRRGVEVLRACDKMLRTGDATEMNRLLVECSPPPEIIDLSSDGVEPAGTFEWQADGGACGWFDYPPAINHLVEEARVRGDWEVNFTHRGHPYRLDTRRKLQVNLVTSTARPVRMVPRRIHHH